MTDTQKQQILLLRQAGQTFTQVAAAVGLPRSTIKSFMRRLELKKEEQIKDICLHCGKRIIQVPKMKPRQYCDAQCRYAYWNHNREKMQRKNPSPIACAYCQKEFDSHGRQNRKYCCRECYACARWGPPHVGGAV